MLSNFRFSSEIIESVEYSRILKYSIIRHCRSHKHILITRRIISKLYCMSNRFSQKAYIMIKISLYISLFPIRKNIFGSFPN